MPTDRPNSTLSAAVDQVLAERLDSPAAARLLSEHGAGFALICRVLADPERRRALAAKPLADRIDPAAA